MDFSANDDNTRSFVPISGGTMISHYKIIEKIGAGGMGEVYLAEDTKLGRRVAMKFLPGHLISNDEIKARFVREAQTLAKLNHPNIVSVYDVNEFNGRPYYVMELVEGKSLNDINPDEPLSFDLIIEYAIQICQGLGEAHRAGIIHRDIKPANIIVDEKGRIRLLDFGLAAVVGDVGLTKTGTTLGTVSYMSPEQVSGREIDHRSDLFSLGIVVYELIAGRQPFKRDNEGATLRAIMEEKPQPLTRYRSDVPGKLQEIVSELLEKDRELRFQSAEGVMAALKRLLYDSSQSGYSRTKTAKSEKKKTVVWLAAFGMVIAVVAAYFIFGKSGGKLHHAKKMPMIAVLPFENLGPPEDQYFADGMTEEITSRLAGISGLGVISRTSSVKIKESDRTLQEIGQEHGVDYVLEGTVRWSKTGDQPKVRITPQLIRVSDDRHLWADNYERALMEVFAVQADIAEKIVNQLGLTLVESDRINLAEIPTGSPEAYQYYLKALQEIRRGSNYSGSIAAQIALDSAVSVDPSFALAYALRSEAYSNGAGSAPDSKYGKIAKESARRSLELQPGLPEGHLALGNYYFNVEDDYARALDQFTLAGQELHNDPELLHSISEVQIEQGKFELALNNRRMAAELDPLNGRRHAALASVLEDIQKFTEAEQSINRAIVLEPEAQEYYEKKIEISLALFGDLEKVRPIISQALQHCDTTLFVLKNSSITRYIPELNTDSIIENYIERFRADTSKSKHIFLSYLPFFYRSHLDILENYEDEARMLAEWFRDREDFVGWKALLLSFLGECEQAIECGMKVKEQASAVNRSHRYGQTDPAINLARIYSNCGDYEKAMDELELVLSLKTNITVNTLKFERWIDPFRDQPRYKQLIADYAFNPED